MFNWGGEGGVRISSSFNRLFSQIRGKATTLVSSAKGIFPWQRKSEIE